MLTRGDGHHYKKAGKLWPAISTHDWWNVKLLEAFDKFFQNSNKHRNYEKYFAKKCIPSNLASNSRKSNAKIEKSVKRGKGKKSTTSKNQPKIFRKNTINTLGEIKVTNVLDYLGVLDPKVILKIKLTCPAVCLEKAK